MLAPRPLEVAGRHVIGAGEAGHVLEGARPLYTVGGASDHGGQLALVVDLRACLGQHDGITRSDDRRRSLEEEDRLHRGIRLPLLGGVRRIVARHGHDLSGARHRSQEAHAMQGYDARLHPGRLAALEGRFGKGQGLAGCIHAHPAAGQERAHVRGQERVGLGLRCARVLPGQLVGQGGVEIHQVAVVAGPPQPRADPAPSLIRVYEARELQKILPKSRSRAVAATRGAPRSSQRRGVGIPKPRPAFPTRPLPHSPSGARGQAVSPCGCSTSLPRSRSPIPPLCAPSRRARWEMRARGAGDEPQVRAATGRSACGSLPREVLP